MTDLQQDLADRWRPNDEQIDGAEQLLGYFFDGPIWTTHLLIHKEFGLWTDKVEVLPLDGWFLSMEHASEYGRLCAQAFHANATIDDPDAGRVTVGYTAHTKGKNWAVFEDILSIRS